MLSLRLLNHLSIGLCLIFILQFGLPLPLDVGTFKAWFHGSIDPLYITAHILPQEPSLPSSSPAVFAVLWKPALAQDALKDISRKIPQIPAMKSTDTTNLAIGVWKKLFFCHHWLHFSIIMGQKVFFTSKELLLGEGSFALVPSFQKILFPQKILRWTSWEWNYSMTHFSISWCPPVDHFAHDIVICTSGWRAVLPMDMCVWIPDPRWISNPILVSWWVLLLFLG